MNRIFYTYTLAKTLYERGKDYIDTFWPFVLKVLPEDKNDIELVSIQEKLKESFGLDVPEYSLKTIINRAEGKRYVEVVRDRYRLTEEGSNYLDSLETESAVERRINGLLGDIKKYLNEQLELSLEIDKVYDILLSFVKEYFQPVMEFFKPDSELVELDVSKVEIREYEEEIVNYFKIAKQQKPTFYNTLQDIVYGSIISTVASSPDIAEVNKGFVDTVAFLDSNFLFSVFGFDFPEFNKPAGELFDLLKSYKIKLKVFDFTIDEMVRVLRNYPREQHIYVPDVRVDSIYSSLKSQGQSAEDIRLFIQKIERRMRDLGIEVEQTDVDLKKYKPEKEEYLIAILRYKPIQPDQSRNHDLAVIEEIKKIRSVPKREIETSDAFFLTSDLRLSKFNLKVMRHKERATICEIIPDRLLTNILWLKNPTVIKDIPLKSIIAIHSRKVFVDRKIWKRFYENIRRLREEGRVSDGDISMLFYNHQIEKVLSRFDVSEIEKITPDFILENFGHITKKVEKKIREDSKRTAERWTNIILRVLIVILILIVLSLTPVIIKNWEVIEPIHFVFLIIVLIVSIGGYKITSKKIKGFFEKMIFKKICKKKLTEVKELFQEAARPE